MAYPPEQQKIIDTHLHILQPSRFRYHWMESDSPLNRDFQLNEVHEEMRASRVVGGILIEATNTPQEIGWLLDLCAHEPFYKGVIGWIDLKGGHEVAQIDRFSGSPYFKGVRLNCLDRCRNLGRLGMLMQSVQRLQLIVEVLARFENLPEIVTFMRSYPDVTFVLDHLGGAAINEAGLEAWGTAMQWLANLPNVIIKVSGYGIPTVAILCAYIRVALEIVGGQRLMFGSNWPMFPKTSTYTELVEHVRAAVADLDHATIASLFHDTAVKLYQLEIGS